MPTFMQGISATNVLFYHYGKPIYLYTYIQCFDNVLLYFSTKLSKLLVFVTIFILKKKIFYKEKYFLLFFFFQNSHVKQAVT